MRLSGKKEVAEAVIIAALTALATGLVELGLKYLEERAMKKKKRKAK